MHGNQSKTCNSRKLKDSALDVDVIVDVDVDVEVDVDVDVDVSVDVGVGVGENWEELGAGRGWLA